MVSLIGVPQPEKMHYGKMLSVTLIIKPMTLKMSSLSYGHGDETVTDNFHYNASMHSRDIQARKYIPKYFLERGLAVNCEAVTWTERP